MKNKFKYLVTGSAGFIGFSLAKRLLDDGYEVVGIDDLNDYYDINLKNRRNKILKKYNNFKFVKLDFSNTIALNKVLSREISTTNFDRIFHLGAQAGVRYSISNPLLYAQSNYIGTLNIFEFAKKNNIKKVIYASSSSVYGNSKPPYSETDSDTDTPISVYAATKKATEVLAHTYAHLHNMTMVGLRFFTVYGPFGRPDMATHKFTKNILLEKEIDLYAKGRLKRGFTYIDDVIEAMIQCQKINKGNHIINLGGNELVEVNSLVKILEKNLNMKAKIKFMPMQSGDVAETQSVQSIARDKLNFNPKVNFEDGIKMYCDWFLENKDWLLKLKDSKQ